MSKVIPTTLVLLLFVSFSTSSAQSQVSVKDDSSPQKRKCEPIGRLMSVGVKVDNHVFPRGSLLCSGDRIVLANKGTAEVLCYLNRKLLQLTNGIISEPRKCAPEATEIKPCTREDRSNCPIPKGSISDSNSTPTLIKPYSAVLLNDRPLLSWHAVTTATSYIVQISGEGVNWSSTANNSVLPYPKEQAAMRFGNAYKIIVIANCKNYPIGASKSVVNILSADDVKQVMARVEQIIILGKSRNEDISQDLDAIYMSKGLLNETIETLTSIIKSGHKSPTIYRLLGDRYLQAGFVDNARIEYNKAIEMASNSNNFSEFARAQDGINRLLKKNK